MPSSHPDEIRPLRVRCAVVLRVEEQVCEVWSEGAVVSASYAPHFPSPRVARVLPGHLVAVATAPDGVDVVVWRWYDAVVLGAAPDGSVRLWEPAHGEVVATPRPAYQPLEPGSRAYVSAGLPGAEWWVAGPAVAQPEVDFDEVIELYDANGLWPATFDQESNQ